jgi:hypothetical protein
MRKKIILDIKGLNKTELKETKPELKNPLSPLIQRKNLFSRVLFFFSKHKIISISFCFLLLLFISLIVIFIASKSSKPGDLLYPIKSFVIDNQMPTDEVEIIEFRLGYIKELLSYFTNTKIQNNCIQAILIEEEIVNQLIEVNKITNLENDYKPTYFPQIYYLLKNINYNNTENCSLNSNLSSYALVYRILSAEFSQDIEYSKEITRSEKSLEEYKNLFKSQSFHSQGVLSEVTTILELYAENTKKLGPLNLGGDYVTLNKVLIENEAISQYLDVILNSNLNEITEKRIIFAVCKLRLSKVTCDNSQINSQLNSISSKIHLRDRIIATISTINTYISIL